LRPFPISGHDWQHLVLHEPASAVEIVALLLGEFRAQQEVVGAERFADVGCGRRGHCEQSSSMLSGTPSARQKPTTSGGHEAATIAIRTCSSPSPASTAARSAVARSVSPWNRASTEPRISSQRLGCAQKNSGRISGSDAATALGSAHVVICHPCASGRYWADSSSAMPAMGCQEIAL